MSEVDDALAQVVATLGGSRRHGQHEMAEAVMAGAAAGRHVLVQAGTGTGKSLAYLVPAILRAARGVDQEGSNRTVLATATLALQRQLTDHDLPTAVAALAPEVSFAVSKGRHNYVCLEKANRQDGSGDDEDLALFDSPRSVLGRQAKKLRLWIAATATGDRDDYTEELDSRLWRSVSVSGRECIGAAKCVYGQDCFAEAARARAAASDIVVTNHALLVLDVVEGLPILPPHDLVVIDEAHELVERTTSALAGSIDEATIERAARQLRRFTDEATHDRLLEVAVQVAAALGEFPDGVTRISQVNGALHAALTALRDVCAVAQAQSAPSSLDDPSDAAAKKRGRADLQDVAHVAAELLGGEQATVRWISRERISAVHVAPLAVADYLREHLLARSTTVMTSATLQIAGSMEPVAMSLGLDPAQRDSTWTGLDVGSPFDYPRQGILYCAAHLPAPTPSGVADEALDELATLIEAAGGRTLALFSSWRGVERAAAQLATTFQGRADRPLIVAERGDSVAQLVREFRAQPRASLLGTVSLWQGIDVPGDTCTLVTIDRIPFPRPDDPVLAARSAMVDAQGGSGFTAVQVPRAALLLAQGVGRLIRTTSDRGVVAVLDSRLATKGYGATMRKTLPPLWYTTDQATVVASLRNLDAAAAGQSS